MLLYLINPANPLASMSFNRGNYWNRFRLWKPLGCHAIAGLTPSDWEVTILDENLGPIDYDALPRPDARRHHRLHLSGSQSLRDRRLVPSPRRSGDHGRHPRDDVRRRGEPATWTR